MAKAATLNIRFEPEERELIDAYAGFIGTTPSNVVREAVLEKLEEYYDIKAYNEALAEDDGEYTSWAEIKTRLGL